MNETSVMLIKTTNLDSVQYFGEFYRHEQAKTGTLFLRDVSAIRGRIAHGVSVLLSGMDNTSLRKLLPDVYSKGLNGQSLSGMQLAVHNKPKVFFRQLIPYARTYVIRGTKKIPISELAEEVMTHFWARKVETSNVNLASPRYWLDEEDGWLALNIVLRLFPDVNKDEILAELMPWVVTAKKRELLKSIFRFQTICHGGDIMIKLEKNPGKNARISIVQNEHEIEQCYLNGSQAQLFFARQEITLPKLIPTMVELGKYKNW